MIECGNRSFSISTVDETVNGLNSVTPGLTPSSDDIDATGFRVNRLCYNCLIQDFVVSDILSTELHASQDDSNEWIFQQNPYCVTVYKPGMTAGGSIGFLLFHRRLVFNREHEERI